MQIMRYRNSITIREWMEQNPEIVVDENVTEGYGDGYYMLEEVLDEDYFTIYLYEDGTADITID